MVTNDDGINSEGLITLADTLKSIADVWVVAPEREMSAVSHSLTLHRPLRVKEVSKNCYCVDGTPTDCVHLGVHCILSSRPNLVISGVNKGGNLGCDIAYSGTVSAAMEGTVLGIPSFAISLVAKEDFEFQTAASFALRLATYILKNGLPKGTLLNVNIPNAKKEEIRQYRITRQGKRIHGSSIVEKTDPRGEKYYWFADNNLGFEEMRDSDSQAIEQNCISITPLLLDMTDHASIEDIDKWVF